MRSKVFVIIVCGTLFSFLLIAASLPKYVGRFYGDGAGLTNLDGSKLIANTVSTNSWDATALAFAASGGGGVAVTASGSASATTNANVVNVSVGESPLARGTWYVVAEGDSLTSGYDVTPGWFLMWSNRFCTNAGVVFATNVASAGTTCQTMIDNYAYRAKPFVEMTGTTNSLVFFWAGINDLNTQTYDTVWGRITNYWGIVKTNPNARLVAFTIPGSYAMPAAQRANLQTLNLQIKTSTLPDYIIDAGTMFGDTYEPASPDGLHWGTNANIMLAMEVQDVLKTKKVNTRFTTKSSSVLQAYTEKTLRGDRVNILVESDLPGITFQTAPDGNLFDMSWKYGVMNFYNHSGAGNVAGGDLIAEWKTSGLYLSKGLIVYSNSWTTVPTLAAGDNWYTSSNGVPVVIWKDAAAALHTNYLATPP